MKYTYLLLLICLLFGNSNRVLANKPNSIRDSLLHTLSPDASVELKVQQYRNLADLYIDTPQELEYLKKLYAAALETKNTTLILETLTDLAYFYINQNKVDSTRYYVQLLESSGSHNEILPYLCLLKIKEYEVRTRNGDKDIFKETTTFLKDKKIDPNCTYMRIVKEYVTGCGLCFYKKENALSYLEQAYQYSQNISGKEKLKIQSYILWSIATYYGIWGKKQLHIETLEKCIDQDKLYYEKHIKPTRPYYRIELYLLPSYSTLVTYSNDLPKKKSQYYINQILQIKDIPNPVNKFNVSWAIYQYNLLNKNYAKAIAEIDSIAVYLKETGSNNDAEVLKIKAEAYALSENYQEAFNILNQFIIKKDSIVASKTASQLNELQVQYDVSKLNFENANLQNEKKFIVMLTLGIILLLSVAIIAYLYYTLRKEKRTKKVLHRLKKKAEESEEMKTAFLNSMCHEIRTPLNAIVGFSGIIIDDELDKESKQEFYELITDKTNELTSIIENLLMIANLDTDGEGLILKKTNINELCQSAFEHQRHIGKGTLRYVLNLPQETLYIDSHKEYLLFVINSVLDNANKFTEQGSITLDICRNEKKQRLFIKITDTGCGIPKEKQASVFERFTKLDAFAQGNGLGLYLCKQIIKRLSGDIYIDSDYTTGVRVVIELPYQS